MHDDPLRCSKCGKVVSTPVPADTVVRAWIECPECIAVEPPSEDVDRIELARWTQLIERLKTLGYTPWLSADELARYGDVKRNRDLMREFEQMADHLAHQNEAYEEAEWEGDD